MISFNPNVSPGVTHLHHKWYYFFLHDLICLLTASQRRRKHFARELTVPRDSASLYIFIYSSASFSLSFSTFIYLERSIILRFRITNVQTILIFILFIVFLILICYGLRYLYHVYLSDSLTVSCCHKTCTRSNTRWRQARNPTQASHIFPQNENTVATLS